MLEELIEPLTCLCVFASICLFFASLYLGFKMIMSLFSPDNKDYKSKYENLKKEIEDKKSLEKERYYSQAINQAYESGLKEGLKNGRKK